MNALPSTERERVGRFAKGWTPERRARQAERIRDLQPWRRSTGPKTDSGKARVAMNALRHGCRSQAWLLKARRIRNAIRLCASTVLLVRALSLLARRQAGAVRNDKDECTDPNDRCRPDAITADMAGKRCLSRPNSSAGLDPPCAWRDPQGAVGSEALRATRSRHTSTRSRENAANHPFPRLR